MIEPNTFICADSLDVLREIPDKTANLIIVDPPYFRIKGKFDFVYKSFDDYLLCVEKWGVACKKTLSENGTLFWFGDEKKIAYSQIILDKLFGLLNSLVWEKAEKDGMYGQTGSEQLRSFPISTERILMYSNDVYNLTQCVYCVRDYIRAEIIRAKGNIVLKDINTALGTATNGGGVASACLSIDKAEPAMFTKEMYERLRMWLNDGREYDYLRREYEELRREYEELRREFNNYSKSTEVLKVRFKPNDLKHETIKPVELYMLLILTCSRPGDLIIDPFCGSGTTALACHKTGRRFICIDREQEYIDIAQQRYADLIAQQDLFLPEPETKPEQEHLEI